MHGRLSPIRHDASALFAGIPQGFLAVRYHSLVVGAVPPELRVTAWTPDGVIMALEHRARPLFGVQFHPESVSTRHGRALLENFRDLTPRRRAAAARGPRRAPALAAAAARRRAPGARSCARPAPGGLVRARGRLRRPLRRPRPRGLARQLPHRRGRRPLLVHRRARRAARPGRPLRRRRPDRRGRARVAAARCARESVFDYCRRELERLRADAPELPFDFVGGFAGYLGFELKAECGDRVTHTSPLPDAAFVLCDRVIAFDHRERRIHLLALDRRRRRRRTPTAWLAATEQRLACARARAAAAAAGARPARHPALRAARLAGGLPGEHRRLPARDLRGRELRDLPDDGAAQRRGRSTR